MPRTVDPERYAARRLRIIDAAFSCFATDGYEGATTASICRRAGIGSGTFFHYFPTKAAVLLGILEIGTHETQDWFHQQADRDDARAVLTDWVRHHAAGLADPRLAGFVRAVGAVMTEPDVAAALATDDAATYDGLLPWVRRAQGAGEVRHDLPAEDLTAWVLVVLDGFLGRTAADEAFTAAGQRAVLLDVVDRVLAPR